MSQKLKGAKELDAKLRQLAAEGGGKDAKVLRGAMRAAMQIPLKAAKAEAATLNESGEAHRTYKGRLVAPGFASRNLRIVTVGGRSGGGKFRTVLGVRREAFYAVNFMELGTARIARRPWLEPAFSASAGATVDRFADVMRKRIEQIARKR